MKNQPVVICKSLIRRLKHQVNPPPRTRRQIDALISNNQLDEALAVLHQRHSRQANNKPALPAKGTETEAPSGC